MQIEVLAADRLTPEHVAAWSHVLATEPALESPFFRPEFTQAVAAVRHDVEVAVLREDDRPVGFFPYQRQRGNVAVPVGGLLCDFQGLVVRRGASVDARQLLRGCGLAAWHFNHLLASQEPFRPYHSVTWESPYMDLGGGFEAYRKSKHEAGRGTLAQAERKARKIAREIGPLRLVPHTCERDVFELLMDWKVQQYRRIKATNFLAPAWTVALLERVWKTQSPAFAGMLSVLYAGDRPAALHLGMRAGGVLHVWFPAYDPALAGYSPGLILWLELARAAAALGLRRIDLGKGQERYKASLQSGASQLAEGSVDFRLVAGSLRRGWLCTRELVRASPLRRPGQAVLRYARHLFQPHSG
ncbi:MAG: GNAT family N-acetyltransferase [Thermoguttaceae bacterium]|jgi:CelD/BcsL family acetyltransferase involved in cellulose biosynthesis